MFASTLSMVFTVVFVVTGVYSLAQLAQSLAGAEGDRLAELFHLVMSLAMIGMAWAWTGGGDTNSGRLQIVVFGAFTAWFGYGALTRSSTHGRVAAGYHVLMGAAMTWMVAAMSLTMGPSSGSSGGGHHGSPTPVSDVDAPVAAAPTPGWVVAVTVLFVLLLVAAAGWWVLRTVRADDSPPEPSGALATRTAVRTDAGCHLLMSLGMAGMLIAML